MTSFESIVIFFFVLFRCKVTNYLEKISIFAEKFSVMTEEELRQELDFLQCKGLNPMLCDTPIPLVDVPVLAGQPRAAGDATPGQYVMVPRELLGHHPVFLIDVDGYSMRDAGILPGDRLEVEIEARVEDGDIVVAEVDGDCTVKTFFTDDFGEKWLVPRNDEFQAIRLSGHQWRIVGKVTGLRKGMPRTTFADCMNAVDRQRRVLQQQPDGNGDASLLPTQPPLLVLKKYHNRRHIDYMAIRSHVERIVVMQIKHRYEWYAVYRVMADLNLLDELQLSKFALQMQAWFPDVTLGCTSDSLGEYATGPTGKAFTLWSADEFRRDKCKRQSLSGFNTLWHHCEALRAALFPLPLVELQLPF